MSLIHAICGVSAQVRYPVRVPPVLVNRLILDFLSDHQPEKMMSLRG
jgi:hypothetical protein